MTERECGKKLRLWGWGKKKKEAVKIKVSKEVTTKWYYLRKCCLNETFFLYFKHGENADVWTSWKWYGVF